MKQLQGMNAILTGASRGLGVYIACALAEKGVNLVLTARSVSSLEEVRDNVEKLGAKAVVIPTDLSDNAQVKSLATEAESKLGPIDILINNAGVEFSSSFGDFPDEDIELSVQVNLIAPMLLTRALLPGMLERGRGHIVNISSLAGKTGLPYETPYSTTKAGLIMFTHSLRTELVDRPVGISVICPGFVSGDGMYARKAATGNHAPKIMKPTTPEKVAKAVIKVIRQDISEMIINPLPMRPGLVLREIAPGIIPSLHKLTGTLEYARSVSEKHYEG